MAATLGSNGSGSSAGAISYQDKTIKAHDRFWPEVNKVEPILADIKSKLHKLSQSQLAPSTGRSHLLVGIGQEWACGPGAVFGLLP